MKVTHIPIADITGAELDAVHLAGCTPNVLPIADHAEDLHVIPASQGHRCCARCWCGPRASYPYPSGGRIWMHYVRDEAGN